MGASGPGPPGDEHLQAVQQALQAEGEVVEALGEGVVGQGGHRGTATAGHGRGFLAAFGLLLWLRFSLIWLGVWLGLIVPNPEAAGGLFAVAFPLTMISSIFVAPQLMPDWLGRVAAWNPISSTAAATRDLFGTPVGGGDSWVERHALLMSGLWPLVLTAVFLPLAVRRFQKLSR